MMAKNLEAPALVPSWGFEHSVSELRSAISRARTTGALFGPAASASRESLTGTWQRNEH